VPSRRNIITYRNSHLCGSLHRKAGMDHSSDMLA
jgi:hypothetical protein